MRQGEELAAAVTYRATHSVDVAELTKHCAGGLAYFEVPTRWQLGDAPLPTLAGEKLNKKAIRAAFLGAEQSG